MKRRFGQKFSFKNSFATFFLMSAVLSCSNVLADGFLEDNFFEYVSQKNAQKLYNPIHLDTSNTTEIKPQANTTIPFNMRKFDEADYFSSSIEEPQYSKQTPPPSQNLQPENEVLVTNTIESESADLKEIEQVQYSAGTDFFAPVKEENQVEKEEKPFNYIDSSIFAENSEEETLISEYEGKTVSNINFVGLNSISSDYVSSLINTQKGVLYNPNLLQNDLQKIYSCGYFTDEMTVEPTLEVDDTISLTFVLKENILVKNVVLKGNTIFSEQELSPYISKLKNKPQNLLEINNAIDSINEHYREKGYILAVVDSIDDTTQGTLTFTILEGVINKINIVGNERTKDYIIERNIITKAGSIYNEEVLKKDLAQVFSTQIFEDVDRNIQPSEENPGTFDVSVVVKEKTTNSVGFGGGIDTGLGAFGSISFREDNFMGKAQKVSLSGILGSGILLSDASIKNHMNYQAELSFFEPYFLNADNSLMSKLYFREMGSWTVPLAIERRIGASVGVQHKVKGNDKLATSFTAGIEHIKLKEGDYNKISSLYNKHGLNIRDRARQLDGGFYFNLTPGVRYSSLDNNENPREGIIAQARFTEAIGVTDFNRTHGRLNGAVTKFFPVFKKSSFSLTAKGGIKVHGDEMPEVLAYRLGGPYTIRGYRMNGVGTGESFMMGSAEFATPLPFVDRLRWDIFKKMRLTFFVDAGKVFNPTITNTLFDRPEYAVTAGVGLRVFIPGVGPISVDYGLPITNPGSFGSKGGYVTFGSGGMNVYGY